VRDWEKTIVIMVMKTKRRPTLLVLTPLLFASVSALPVMPCSAQKQPTRSTANTNVVSSPPPGFYFEVSPCPRCERCRPCTLNAGWQVKMMRLLGASGISSFPGQASGLEKANEEFGLVASIKRFSKPASYDAMVYVGPFENERAAIAAIRDLCAAMDEVGIMESSCDEMTAKREGSTFYTRGSFDVSGIHLVSK
jgi:hypothetical protein